MLEMHFNINIIKTSEIKQKNDTTIKIYNEGKVYKILSNIFI